ncbi:RecX family transcriptional regulator [Candidatus Microgenomates bacterium]|nr:RecX family transcriptional regulator [Candidatus Microgenomates bacterium]
MAIITSIEQQKKRETRVNVYLDNKFAFGIDLDNFVILGLKVGQEITEEQVTQIIRKAEFQKTYEKLLRFAMLRPRSEKEIDGWFKRKKVPEQIWSDLIKKIKHLDLLDDLKFAAWWIDQRNSFKPRSKKLLKLELLQKGIDKETISQVLSDQEMDEVAIATHLLERKKSLIEKLPDESAKQKLVGFLSRKGFNWETIDMVIKRVTNDQKMVEYMDEDQGND